MLNQRGRISAAVLEYRRALGRSPHSAVVMNRLGSSLARRGAPLEGAEVLKKTEELYPDYGPTYKYLALIYQGLEELSLAADYYLKAIRINPFDPSLHAGRMVVLKALGRAAEAGEEEALLKKLLPGRMNEIDDDPSHTGDADE